MNLKFLNLVEYAPSFQSLGLSYYLSPGQEAGTASKEKSGSHTRSPCCLLPLVTITPAALNYHLLFLDLKVQYSFL